MSAPAWPDLSRTRAALQVWREGQPARHAQLDTVSTSAEIEAWQAAERKALELVQDAFHLDTSDRNTLGHCRHATIGYLRDLVRSWEHSLTKGA